MSDDTVVPMPNVQMLPPIHKGNAAEMAKRKADIERAARTERQKAARLKAQMAMGDSAEQAEIAAASQVLKDKSIEDLADMAVRKMAKVTLLGGEAFAPASLREACDAASAWANIAYKEAAKRRALNVADDDDDTPAEAAAKAMRQLKKSLRDKQKAG